VGLLIGLPGFASAKVQNVVDVGNILDGNPVNLTYEGWAWGGIGLDNLTGTGVLAFKIENGTDSAFIFNGMRIGAIKEGMPSLFVISLEGMMPGPEPLWVMFQTVEGMSVSIYKQEGMLGVPEGGVVIQGITQYHAGQFESEFSFPSNDGYNITITTTASYMGIVDGSISHFGSGSDSFFLRAGGAAGISTIRIFDDYPTSFTINATVSNYYEGSGSIPPNANPEIYIHDGYVDIGVTEAIFDQNQAQANISLGEIVGQELIYGYDLNHSFGQINVTLYSENRKSSLDFNFNLAYRVDRGLWYDDDNPGDDDGYGFYTNYEGPTISVTGQIPKYAMWFDIRTSNDNGNDGDTDGLAPQAEKYYGTDVDDEDSDGDGLDDWWEVIYGLDPLKDYQKPTLYLNQGSYDDGYVEVPDHPELRFDGNNGRPKEFTITAWVKPYIFYYDEHIIIEKSDDEDHISWAIGVKRLGDYRGALFARIDGIETDIEIYQGDFPDHGEQNTNTDGYIIDFSSSNKPWYYVAVTYSHDGSDAIVKLFIDDLYINSEQNICITECENVPSISTGNTGPVRIGNSINVDRYWNGEINEVAIFQRRSNSMKFISFIHMVTG